MSNVEKKMKKETEMPKDTVPPQKAENSQNPPSDWTKRYAKNKGRF